MDPLAVPRFELRSDDPRREARRGSLMTPHGVIETPAFLPVGTYGAVRGMDPDELREIGVQAILANTYHLHLRPGEQVVGQLGGLHGFMGWERPILTDSGGFQIFSLDHLCECTDDGVRFRSALDGSQEFLTPERCIEIQERLGADLIVTLDQFEPVSEGDSTSSGATRARALAERTLAWAERSQAVASRRDQLLFGIVQGGGSTELRREFAERTGDLDFEAFAIGGLGIGEPPEVRATLVEATVARLPFEAPRYLMGVGMPQDLIEAVERGVDLFDCVVPTRHARHGSVFTRAGRLHVRNAAGRDDGSPLDPDCPCRVCQRFSRAYLCHLIRSKEMLGSRLLTYHNLAYFMNLFREMRAAIEENRFRTWATEWREAYCAGPSSATHSAA